MLEFKKDTGKAIIALALPLALLAVFTFWPIINALRTAFLDDYVLGGSLRYYKYKDFIGETAVHNGLGIANFKYLFTTPIFWESLKNTGLIVIITVPLTILIGLAIAVGLNSITRLQGVFQTVFFLPYVTNTIALGLVFYAMFGRYGAINAIFGLGTKGWISGNANYWDAFLVLTLYSVWNGLSFKILVFLSGLQSIDKQYYQAAQIDSASRWTIFKRITVPLLSPMILYITITSFIGAFKVYSSVIAIFGNGKFGPATNDKMMITVVGYIYSFIDNGGMEIGRAAAGSIILFIIILIITLVQFQVSKKRVHY